jgi:Protein of unknown function (DUF1419)
MGFIHTQTENIMTKQCYYVPGSTSIVDTLNEEGLTFHFRNTLEEVLQRYPRAELWEAEKAFEEIHRLTYEKYISAPAEITEDRFDEMLNVLPPMKWRQEHGSESFMISEALTMDIRSIFCRIGDRCFEMADRQSLTHQEICDECRALIAA